MIQEELHTKEMEQSPRDKIKNESIFVHKNWKDYETVTVPMSRAGHGGGDKRLHDKIFVTPNTKDPFERAAGSRDGVMSVLVGIAARKSIETGNPIKIEGLTDLVPLEKKI